MKQKNENSKAGDGTSVFCQRNAFPVAEFVELDEGEEELINPLYLSTLKECYHIIGDGVR